MLGGIRNGCPGAQWRTLQVLSAWPTSTTDGRLCLPIIQQGPNGSWIAIGLLCRNGQRPYTYMSFLPSHAGSASETEIIGYKQGSKKTIDTTGARGLFNNQTARIRWVWIDQMESRDVAVLDVGYIGEWHSVHHRVSRR